jgi:hypothetical protein
MNSLSKRSGIASAVVGAVVIVICIVGLLRDVQLPSQDVVSWRHSWKRTYVERWQEEMTYGICALLAGGVFAAGISKLSNNIHLTNRCSRRLAGAIPSALMIKILQDRATRGLGNTWLRVIERVLAF